MIAISYSLFHSFQLNMSCTRQVSIAFFRPSIAGCCCLGIQSSSSNNIRFGDESKCSRRRKRRSVSNSNLSSSTSSLMATLVDSNSCLSSSHNNNTSTFSSSSSSSSDSYLPKVSSSFRKILEVVTNKNIYRQYHSAVTPSILQYKNQLKNHLQINFNQQQISTTSIQQLQTATKNNNTKNMAQIISGKEVADEIRAKLKTKVESLNVKPKLAIVQVGGREDSNVYIKMKIQFAESIGASAELIKLSNEISEDDLAKKVKELNEDSTIHGIITQLPFDCKNKIDSDRIVNLIDPKKDVDGLCVYNAGKLLHGELNSQAFIACTPNGCMELIKKSGIKLEGTRSVVIGRSKIVGSPMAQLLVWHNSTVTICHSRTKNLDEICRQADIVVAAVGRAQMVKGSWLKPGAVVIDCGINVIPDATRKSGTRLVGDVDFDDCKEVASAITPVPGGVGPMTVAMLISNTVEAASRSTSSES